MTLSCNRKPWAITRAITLCRQAITVAMLFILCFAAALPVLGQPGTEPVNAAIEGSGNRLVTSFRGQPPVSIPERSLTVRAGKGDSLMHTLVKRQDSSSQYIVEFVTPPLARQIPQGRSYTKSAGLPALREASRDIRLEHERFREDLRRLEAEKGGHSQGSGGILIGLYLFSLNQRVD